MILLNIFICDGLFNSGVEIVTLFSLCAEVGAEITSHQDTQLMIAQYDILNLCDTWKVRVVMWNALVGICGCLNLFVHGWHDLTSSINLQMSIFM
jgi:hypothetical protein